MNRRTCQLVAMVATAAIVVAACGSDDDAGSGDTAAVPTGVTETSGSVGSSLVTTAPPATTAGTGGGAVVDRTGETIKIGFINEDEGVFAFPEYRIGGNLAFDQINKTGGINAAQIELVPCSTNLTPESSINCANQMVEKGVAIAFTGIDLTSDASLPILQEAGIPYVTSNNWGDAQATAPGSHLLHVATDAYTVAAFTLLKSLGLTKMAYLYAINPAADNIVNNIMPPIAEGFGAELETIGVDGAAPDWTAAASSAIAGGAELIYGLIDETNCTAMVDAVRAADFTGTIIAGACSDFMKDLGDDSVGVYTLMDQLQPSAKGAAPSNIAQHLDEYETLMADEGEEKFTEGYAIWTFGAVMELRTILESIRGEITGESVEAALNRDIEIPGWFGPAINCGAAPWPDSPAHCSATLGVYQTKKADDGELVREEVLPFFDAYAELQEQK